MRDKIAVLIPCYNEEKTVARVVKDYKEAFPEAVVYVYDNNSVDNTVEEALKAGAVVRKEFKQGKGNVIRKMFKDIDAECYIMVDGDCTYKPCKDMAEYILIDGYDMVIGDRLSSSYFEENKRPFHGIGNRVVRWLVNKLFKVRINDIMTGSRAFSYGFAKTFPVLSKGFEVETEMSIHSAFHNLSIKEVQVDYKDRPEGSVSKLSTFSDGIKVISTIVRLFKEYKPMLFFGTISLVFFVASVVFGVPVFIDFFRTGLVDRLPTLVFTGVLFTTSQLLFVAGVILEVIVKKNKQLFEMFWLRSK